MTAWMKVAAVLVVQLGLVAVGVAPQVSARTTGEEYLLRVQPYDPIDPFRGAYVDLSYPDLALNVPDEGDLEADGTTVYLVLREKDGVWVSDGAVTERPDDGPYLTCDHHSWRLRCGIESYFLPQDQAASFDELVGSGQAVAVVRIDGRGHAALVDVRSR
ncbi:GDYXXLXY domain-containing protein [Nocardioides sp.]|uniref:GDYXXLXY domain-containing protein n=1 Tax=Nocardioides sp. TaxID=35761 RepID=UPI003528DF57